MELTQMLILYLVILIAVSLVALLIVTNRTNLRIRFIIRQIKQIKDELYTLSHNLRTDDSDLDVKEGLTSSKVNKIRKNIKKNITTKVENIKNYFENRSTLIEKFATQRVFDKIGILIFLIGVAFFVTVANQYSWINPMGQIFFTIILSGVLLAAGIILRKRFSDFSAVLIGGGISTLIITIFAAFYQHKLLGLSESFTVLFGLIAFGIFVAIQLDKMQIAVIVLTTGYISPVIVNFGTNQYIILFSYILILNVAVIILDIFKKSVVINFLSYIFTFIFYSLWLIKEIVYEKQVPDLMAFIFLTLFYILLFVILTINNIKEGRKFIAIEFSGLFFATSMYYWAGIIIINNVNLPYKGLFTGMLAVFNFIYALILYPRRNLDRRIVNIFFSLSLVFATLIVPVELVGRSISMVWSLQSVLFLWLSQKIKSKNMKFATLWMSFGIFGTLSYELYNTYVFSSAELISVTPIVNRSFVTSIIAIAAMSFNLFLLRRETETYFVFKFIKLIVYKGIIAVFTLVLLYFIIFLEIKYSLIQDITNQYLIENYMGIFNFIFLFVFVLPSLINKKIKILHLVSISVTFISLLLYFSYYSRLFSNLRDSALLTTEVEISQFYTHYIAAAVILLEIILSLRSLKILRPIDTKISFLLSVLLVFAAILLISFELTNYVVIQNYTPDVLIQALAQQSRRLAYTILWCVGSLIYVIVGIFMHNKNIRNAAIFLYVAALIKLFVYDFKYLNTQDLMVAFLTFGTVLLIISFTVQIYYNYEFDKKYKVE